MRLASESTCRPNDPLGNRFTGGLDKAQRPIALSLLSIVSSLVPSTSASSSTSRAPSIGESSSIVMGHSWRPALFDLQLGVRALVLRFEPRVESMHPRRVEGEPSSDPRLVRRCLELPVAIHDGSELALANPTADRRPGTLRDRSDLAQRDQPVRLGMNAGLSSRRTP